MNNYTNSGGHQGASGDVQLRRLVELGDLSARPAAKKAPLSWRVANFLANRRKTVGQVHAANFVGKVWGLATFRSELSLMKASPDWKALASNPDLTLKLKVLLRARTHLTPEQEDEIRLSMGGWDLRFMPAFFGGEILDYGLVGRRLVTDAGVASLVDAFEANFTISNYKYHGFGTGTTAEAAADTALVTELTTEYAVNSTRPTGSQTESSAPVYVSVGTLSPDSGGTLAITELGLFSAVSSTTLWDRTKFTAVNLVASADSLQATYSGTFASGG